MIFLEGLPQKLLHLFVMTAFGTTTAENGVAREEVPTSTKSKVGITQVENLQNTQLGLKYFCNVAKWHL